MNRTVSIATACALAAAAPLSANDSEAEWALGGLVLKASPDISMDREELFLSASEVRVDYIYTNHADSAREVTIAFPLPALPEQSGYLDYANYPDFSALEFSTRINGALAEWDTYDRAFTGTGSAERDVTALVTARGWPVHWVLDYQFIETIQALPDSEKAALISDGLLAGQQDEDGTLRVAPAWRGQRMIVRTQTFAPKASVAVSHRYTPLVGGSVGGMLYPSSRAEYPDGMAEYRAKWCTNDSFLAGIDRRLASAPKATTRYMTETWLGYVLSSGANWRGPIKDFRLVVDKGAPDNLVSLCMDGVTKISPTRFEVVKEDFEPQADLNVLIIQFFDTED